MPRCHMISCIVVIAGLTSQGTHPAHTAWQGTPTLDAAHREEHADCTAGTTAGPGKPGAPAQNNKQ